jgi:hypothetical protein
MWQSPVCSGTFSFWEVTVAHVLQWVFIIEKRVSRSKVE